MSNDKLKNSRVLITGGSGLIGSHITDQLILKKPKEVIIFDNFSRGRIENLENAKKKFPITLIQGDIRDSHAIVNAMDGVDFLFHMAAIRITQCAEQPRTALEVLADGSFNVFEAAVKARVKKVIAASSASIYGLADTYPTDENHHPYNNRTLYGAAKLFNEGLLRSFNEMYGLPYITLRYFNVYGPRMDIYGAYTEVLIRWMERISQGLPPQIYGNGKQTMDFIHVSDIARANILAAESDISDEIINIANGVETSLNELAFLLLKVMNSSLKPEYGPERKVNPVSRRLADIQKAKQMIGFSPNISLEEGLIDLVKWWLKQYGATPHV